jgi:hypothetical protein
VVIHLDDELLVRHAGGQELASEQAEHLAACPDCRARQQTWATLTSAARQGMDADLPVPAFEALVAPALSASRATEVPVVAPTVAWSARVAAAVAWWQVRLLPRSLAAVTVLGLTGAAALAWGIGSAAWGVRAFADTVALVAMLGGVAVAGGRADPRGELWQSVPVAPPAVFFARLLVVVGGNTVLAVAASTVVAATGRSLGFVALLTAWLGPALLSSAVALLGTVWRGAWLGVLLGLLVWSAGTLSTAPSARVDVGVGALAHGLWGTTPTTIALTVLLLAAALGLVGRVGSAVRPAAA